jgi:hypothetical protein
MSAKSRDLSNWLLPAGLATLVVVLVVIALTRGPVELDPDTPEGTVQEYLVAIDEERWDDAVALIHPEWLGACDGQDLSRFSQGAFTAELGATGGFGGVVREQFEAIGEEEPELMPTGDETVEVTIRHTDSGGGVLTNSWDEYVIFELHDDGEFWWIINDPWPYFVWNCRG